MKFVTCMRVKNEEPYLERAIKSLEPLGGEIVFLDDGSTDRTPEIAQSFGVHYFRQLEGLPMDEGRDRTFLLRRALDLNPDWIFTLDGDEELTPRAAEQMRRAARFAPEDITSLQFLFVVMWGKDEYIRAAKFIWPHDRAFRVSALKNRDFAFHSPFHNNLHCGAVPKVLEPYNIAHLNAFIKYWGYETPKACAKKMAFYGANDPLNRHHTAQLIEARNKVAKQKWTGDLDAREMGIQGTVTY